MNKRNFLSFVVVLLVVVFSTSVYAQNNFTSINNYDSRTTPRIEQLIKKMTLEEKISMLSGLNGLPSLNIGKINWTDGPRGPHNSKKNTAFSCGVSFGSTWNPKLIEQAGIVMGKECRLSGIELLLGPGLNILRDPLGGRFFEYYSEDPYLTGQITTGFVKGVQSQKVATSLKHLVCNNREYNRNSYRSMIDERSLREIYLPGFKAAVDAGALTVMTAANGVNDDLVSDNYHLLQEILKDEWGFKGFVLTDWCQTRSTEKAAFAGLDVSMPYKPTSLFGKPLLNAVKEGRVPESLIDDKVRRILYVSDYTGALDTIPMNKGVINNPKENYAIARKIAEEGIVLLKNKNNILPLDTKKAKKIVVMGPNANKRFCIRGLGGSSSVESIYEITAFQGIKNASAKDSKVKYVSTDDISDFKILTAKDLAIHKGVQGFKAVYNAMGKDKKQISRIENSINFVWEMRSPDKSIGSDNFKATFTWFIKAKVSGLYQFRLTADDIATLRTVGRGRAPIAVANIGMGISSTIANVQMVAGETYGFELTYFEKTGDATCRIEWAVPQNDKSIEAAMIKIDKEIKDANAVIFVAGIDHNLDSEGRDRSNMNFPKVQEKLINHIVKVNPNTIVTLINGSPLKLGGWIDNVPAVIEAWYPGMEGGNAIGDILFGKVNPSGRLPFTWVKDLKDIPMYQVDTQSRYAVHYLEEIFVGYRYFESKNVEPQFPFGFGLSYTTFKYDNIKLSSNEMTENGKITVSATITNTGNFDGAEVVQMYIHDKYASVPRPIRELKGFKKIFLKAGESKNVSFEINKASLSFYDVSPNHFCWKAEPGEFIVQIGTSSHDIKLSAPFILK